MANALDTFREQRAAAGEVYAALKETSSMERPLSNAGIDSVLRVSTPCAPGLSSHPGAHGLGSTHLIGRAPATMNHSSIRGSIPHDHDSSGAASL